jgi:hypothetical protein
LLEPRGVDHFRGRHRPPLRREAVRACQQRNGRELTESHWSQRG